VHDFHPPITDAGLYWVVPVPTGALKWDNGGKLVTIEMHDVPVIDQPKWPAHGARATLARMSFKMIFTATDRAVNYDDKAKRFRVTGFLATCRMEARWRCRQSVSSGKATRSTNVHQQSLPSSATR
jgi:hypothetical protein